MGAHFNINPLEDYDYAHYAFRSSRFGEYEVSVVLPAFNEEQSIGYVVRDFARTTRELIEQSTNMHGPVRSGNVIMVKFVEMLWWNLPLRFSKPELFPHFAHGSAHVARDAPPSPYRVVLRPRDLFLSASGRACRAPTPRGTSATGGQMRPAAH
jgi:hypothetical protein